MMYKLYIALGRVLYVLLLPVIRLIIKRTHRVYVAICVDDEVLVVKNWLARDTWRLPGGGYNKRTESEKQAAAREINEELGIEIDKNNLRKVYSDIHITDKLGFRYSVYTAKLLKKPMLKIQSTEITQHKWVKMGNLTSKTQELTEYACASKNPRQKAFVI